MRTAVDANVISALWSRESSAVSMAELLRRARRGGGLVICPAAYAELLAHPKVAPEFVESFLEDTGIDIEFEMDATIWRLAGSGFASYAERRRRSKDGNPKRLLVDFLIGAHASLRADRLLTLDPGRYKQAYPKLTLCP